MCQVKMEHIVLTDVQQDECCTCGRTGHTSDACPWFNRADCTVTRRMVASFGRCRASAVRHAHALYKRGILSILSREGGNYTVVHNEVVKCLF